MMTSGWTDERMDDLKHQVDELGRRMDAGFAEQRSEMNARFDRLEKSLETRFGKVDERFEKVEAHFEARFDKVDERFDKVDERFDKVDERFEKVNDRFDKVGERFEKVDAKFETVNVQIARTQEMVIGLHATLTRFSLGLLGAAIVAVIAALLAS